jgi:hypothetical protein
MFPSEAKRTPLEFRARALERRPQTLRRRSARMLSRTVVMLVFSIIGFLAARELAAAVIPSLAGMPDVNVNSVGPLAPPGTPSSLIFPLVLFPALILSGTYLRRRPIVIAFRTILATVLAAAATSTALAAVIGVRGALVYSFGFAAICGLLLIAGRGVGELFARRVWPRSRGALPRRGWNPLPARSHCHGTPRGVTTSRWLRFS